MSADDWEECPVCREYVGEMVKYLYGKVDESIYMFAKELQESLGDSNGWEVSDDMYDNLDDVETDDEKIAEYIDYLQTSRTTLMPVEIRYSYSISKDGTYDFDFGAECHNCGTEFRNKQLYK